MRQLAYDVLYDATRSRPRAHRLTEDFALEHFAFLPDRSWALRIEDVEAWLALRVLAK